VTRVPLALVFFFVGCPAVPVALVFFFAACPAVRSLLCPSRFGSYHETAETAIVGLFGRLGRLRTFVDVSHFSDGLFGLSRKVRQMYRCTGVGDGTPQKVATRDAMLALACSGGIPAFVRFAGRLLASGSQPARRATPMPSV
jgi:hypothetical protein